MDHPLISIIIPVLHEAQGINALVQQVRDLPTPGPLEVLVVDGAPEADTLAALTADAIPLSSPAGRARQMNYGAMRTRGDILLFLHADTRLPERALHLVDESLAHKAVAGAFSLGFSQKAGTGLKFIAAAANARTWLTRVPYGDQAQFFRRSYFLRRGGYAEIPLMEDIELMERIHRRGDHIALLSEAVTTSHRRWQQEGTIRCTARNLAIRTLYHFGVSPERLAHFYRFGKQ
ncbi:TIGR04283 family arsenosugar biosynthesis glycosyltransferase [Desulfovibrio ferrophilus]|uniref:Glycosyl transferase family 2 n=1 Tax=Desulfovibrio ferrophilus TaxID=241368 RepID=A0A2Z6B2U3_9BACT|nr:TIGR04283 family arsenosugar biosynthesis glycosyltransferase [Desulfovibrio ferrophilus]BBD09783.1 glycosyl transferase family 2 [Desulfovibrio ferrophilus]